MIAARSLPLWKMAPMLRLLLPLATGIILQWYLQFSLIYILVLLGSFLSAFLLFFLMPAKGAFHLRRLQGGLLLFLLAVAGMLLTRQADSRQSKNWYGHLYTDSSMLLVKLEEPLVTKERSYKADASVVAVYKSHQKLAASGKLLLYFTKDAGAPNLQYGQLLLINKVPQGIKNSGNPGAFNYQRYAAFQNIYHQLFLKPADWEATVVVQANWFRSFLFKSRSHVLTILQRYIGNSYKELGIAEALLIGYKEDLDKDLVQAYSNTGVVHIIAISGLHLGLIYAVLLWLLNRIPVIKNSRHAKAILLLSCLWLFSLLTGGAASVLRSAVMFTVIIIGKYYFKQASVYNSLAASAFLLLCYNPYYLWDVGFQLSYLAVIGIIALQQPLYRSFYIKNALLRKIWQMLSVTIAAQVAAFPICMYYFHQFPNMFLVTNLLVIPLSTVILFGEILLIVLAGWDAAAVMIGNALTHLLNAMNGLILYFSSFKFSVWDNIYANMYSTWLLYAFVLLFCAWLLRKKPFYFKAALCFMLVLALFYTNASIRVRQQKKLVVYNVSRQRAIDFIERDKHFFVGGDALKQEGLLQNFHLKPARISMQATSPASQLKSLQQQDALWNFAGRKILLLDSSWLPAPAAQPTLVDVVVLSYNAPISIAQLTGAVKPTVVVFDASNNLWKIEDWEKECEQLHLRCHSAARDGAFVLNLSAR